ncbi:hypothetical protein SCA6_019374 [Theobroma cacao]
MRKMMADKALANTDIQMTVVEAFVGKKKINPPADSSQLHPSVVSLLSEGVAQNSTGNVFVPKDGGDVEISGSPTEKAILSWAVKLGMKYDVIRSESTVLHVFPFNSEKKRGGVALQLSDSQVHIHWKGAAELVLASCSRYLDSNGCLQSIDEEKDYLKAAIDEMATSSLRCIALAYRLCEKEEIPTDEESFNRWVLPEDNLVLLAIVGIKDPCRPGVKDAVKICMDAGVKVRMVTGDNIQTAKAIALECGILSSAEDATEPTIIEGRVFRALSEKEREQVAKKITLLWVNLIMDTLGALALATEPPTDNLMHKTPVGRREPLITNIMWRNLLIQALYQVTVLLALNFAGLSILHLKDDGNRAHAFEVKNTVIFNAFVMCQIFNEFNARKPEEINCFKGVTKNYLFMGIVGFTFILQIIIVEFLGKFTSTVRLDWELWLVSVGIGLVSWPLAMVGKLISVPKTPLAAYLTKPFERCRGSQNA